MLLKGVTWWIHDFDPIDIINYRVKKLRAYSYAALYSGYYRRKVEKPKPIEKWSTSIFVEIDDG